MFRLNARLSIPQLLGLCVLVSSSMQGRVGWSQGSTPEERAAIKQEKEMAEEALKEQRRKNFGSIPEDDDSPLAAEYRLAFKNFNARLTDLDQTQHKNRVQGSTPEKRQQILKEWMDCIAEGNRAYGLWIDKASEVFDSNPTKYAWMRETLREMIIYDVKMDRCDAWLTAAKRLVKHTKPDDYELVLSAGMVGLANNDFEFMEQCWGPARDSGFLSQVGIQCLQTIDTMKERWARELEFRKVEETKDDNPRVELLTSKGRLVIELFEDSAPEAVNNFIYLVERGYYKELPVFSIMQHVMMQTGSQKVDGTGNAGYTIPGEAILPNRRDHFRGSVSLAVSVHPESHKVDPNSGSSQFFIPFVPLPEQDGVATVFGRVIEGQACIHLFRVMNLTIESERKDTKNMPDILISAKVLRKRDHEYRPTVAYGKLMR